MNRLRSCKYCGRVHETSYDCGQKPNRNKETTVAVRLRNRNMWKITRKRVYERDHYMCKVCAMQKCITTDNLEAHHIVPLVEDDMLAYDEDNIITLCSKHHKEADAGKIGRNTLKRMISE